jgi:hypothetical protein
MTSWPTAAANACLMKRRKGKFEPEAEISLDELMPRPGSGAGVETRPGRPPARRRRPGRKKARVQAAI